ncbi:hypothetical protein E2C00_06830 [Streptomyces sp. WAC05374]|uniref:hypothetical protein n=1 Tax=Streptomyces sp. WAC05374 TaxID=2487420 RepID=UPI000F85C75F|nr:hypothetical protein [Streptomyces sp. WAC05374]RST16721.1 hypothetical protein EF905_11470 [Streptomyces sp. WAC05374]TDF45365.1 hypothetical protein E2B92_13760 [Streptomyces sp. WAC05374]TDF55647.1 hypothetical protein E2C02_13940 [Streptomyces sp. WAC05374]TDF58784.1 hypothetical protein E2C00_06830 [Streptomyces sp. WAC05374]
MDVDKRGREPEGCLTAAIRIPVRIVVLIVVVPVRVVWDALTACGRALDRVLLRPLGRALRRLWDSVLTPVGRALAWLVTGLVTHGVVAPCAWLYRWVLAPAGRGVARLAAGFAAGTAWLVTTLVVRPLAWLHRTVLRPLGRGVGLVLWAVLVWPWIALYRWVMTPAGHGLVWLYTHALLPLGRGLWAAGAWLGRVLIVAPALFVHRWVLTPLGRALVVAGREVRDAFVVAWRVAGYVSRAVWRAVAWLVRQLAVRPLTWFYRSVCTPVGHAVRDHLWRPVRRAAAEAGRAAGAALASARETVRRARRDAWRALVGGDRAGRPGEPAGAPARSLGSTTTAPGVAPAPEISLRKRG